MKLAGCLISVLFATVAVGAEGDAPSTYIELAKKLDAAQKNYVSALYRAKNREQEKAAQKLKPDDAEFAGKFIDVARSAPASPAALTSIAWIIASTPGGPEAEEGLRILAEHQLGNPKLEPLLGAMADWPTAATRAFLRTAGEKSSLPEIRGRARLVLGTVLAADARRLGESGKSARDDARALLKSVSDEYGKQKAEEGKTLGDLARKVLSRLDGKSQVGTEVGDEAPEIDGPDHKGDTMRLSGSRGSVVVLVLWGHWCPWCHDIYPLGRSLTYRPGGRSFVLLGINGDADKGILKRTMADEQIAFPNWWLGDNPQIGRDYPVWRYPTTMIIDHRGMIRYRSFGPIDSRSIHNAAMALSDERDNDTGPIDTKPAQAPAKKKGAAKKKRR